MTLQSLIDLYLAANEADPWSATVVFSFLFFLVASAIILAVQKVLSVLRLRRQQARALEDLSQMKAAQQVRHKTRPEEFSDDESLASIAF